MEIKKDMETAMKSGNFVMGTNSVMKAMKNGKLNSVVYATNCPASTMEDLNHYSAVGGVEIKQFDGNSLQMGEFCGKPFNIVLFGITASARKKGK